MKLEKAIELIQADIDNENVDWNSPLGTAYKLAFQATKHLQYERDRRIGFWTDLILGETED